MRSNTLTRVSNNPGAVQTAPKGGPSPFGPLCSRFNPLTNHLMLPGTLCTRLDRNALGHGVVIAVAGRPYKPKLWGS